MRARRRSVSFPSFALTLLALAAGCSPAPKRQTATLTWFAGRTLPAFDPDGPPDALRWALERHLSRGLVERDSTGRIVPGLAESIACSDDSLTWTFHLPAGLRYTDGDAVTSVDVRDALRAGLTREDHGTRAWLLGAVQGMSLLRAGKPLPGLGIETPDSRTLRLRLTSPDRRLLEKLAVPGVSTPWKRREGRWRDAVGVGPYRLLASRDERNLTLVAAAPVAGVEASLDTLDVTFGGSAARARTMLRHSLADVAWPVPQAVLEPPEPKGWQLVRTECRPPRWLLLVLRADLPPLTRGEMRRALAAAVDRGELARALGRRAEPGVRWPAGATRDFEWPRAGSAPGPPPPPAAASPAGRAGGDFTRSGSQHLVLAYDAELAGAEIAGLLQSRWERAGHYVDLRAQRGSVAVAEALAARAAHAHLVEAQALLDGTAADAAQWLMPVRGPAVGAFRSGWRASPGDHWLRARGGPEPSADAVQAGLAERAVVLPIAALPWLVAVRTGAVLPTVHPAYGPAWTRPQRSAPGSRTR